MKDARSQIGSMTHRTLDELVDDLSKDAMAGRVKSLAGLPGVKSSIAVLVSSTNRLVAFKLDSDGSTAQELDYLPDWCKNSFVSSHKKFFPNKRKNTQHDSDNKRQKKF